MFTTLCLKICRISNWSTSIWSDFRMLCNCINTHVSSNYMLNALYWTNSSYSWMCNCNLTRHDIYIYIYIYMFIVWIWLPVDWSRNFSTWKLPIAVSSSSHLHIPCTAFSTDKLRNKQIIHHWLPNIILSVGSFTTALYYSCSTSPQG